MQIADIAVFLNFYKTMWLSNIFTYFAYYKYAWGRNDLKVTSALSEQRTLDTSKVHINSMALCAPF
ncbi:hypothetical protein CW745_01475 [Psychromonas sp. psych-6C06]|nr:hypothetical protein CW745_01475 [Psychromonas sp. psych-6C06]